MSQGMSVMTMQETDLSSWKSRHVETAFKILAWSVNSEDRPTHTGTTQGSDRADISDVTRFESYRAHHPHRNHGVMSLRSRDHSPLVWGIDRWLQKFSICVADQIANS